MKTVHFYERTNKMMDYCFRANRKTKEPLLDRQRALGDYCAKLKTVQGERNGLSQK